jgi:hypothetical protein
MRNVSDKRCTENQNTHFVFSSFFFFRKSCRFEKIWKNTVERGGPQMTIWRMRIECWIPKATYTHTLRLSNTHCFSSTTMGARTRLNVTLYVRCLFCPSLIHCYYYIYTVHDMLHTQSSFIVFTVL